MQLLTDHRLVVLLGVLPFCLALSETPRLNWTIIPDPGTSNTTVSPCLFYNIQVGSDAPSTGLPAAYGVYSFAPKGVPSYSALGENIIWEAFTPAGTVLVNVVDDSQNQGVVSSVSVNPDLTCNPKLSTSKFQVSVNNTNPNPCDPVFATISGGKQPYSTLVVVEGGVISEFAMGPSDNAFTWFNTAPTAHRIIITAIDTNGNLAQSSDFVWSGGTSSSNCAGKQSFSSTIKHKKKLSKGQIAGIAIGSYFVFCLLIGPCLDDGHPQPPPQAPQMEEGQIRRASSNAIPNPGPWNPNAFEDDKDAEQGF